MRNARIILFITEGSNLVLYQIACKTLLLQEYDYFGVVIYIVLSICLRAFAYVFQIFFIYTSFNPSTRH